MGNSVVDLGAAALDYAEGVWDYMTGAPKASASNTYIVRKSRKGQQLYSGENPESQTFFEYLGFEDGGSPAVELQNDGSLPGVDELRYMTPAEVEEGSYSFLQNMEEQMLGHLAAAQSVHDEDIPVRQSLDMKRYHYEEAEKLRNQIEQFKERRASAIQNYPESETKLYMKEGEAPYVKGFPDDLVQGFDDGGVASLGAGEPAYIDMGNMDMNSMFATPAQPGDKYYVGEYPGRVYREGDYITEPGYLGPEYEFEVEGPRRFDLYEDSGQFAPPLMDKAFEPYVEQDRAGNLGIMANLGKDADRTSPLQADPEYPGIEGFDIYRDLAPEQFKRRPLNKQNFDKKRGFQHGQMVRLEAMDNKLMKMAGVSPQSLGPAAMDQMSDILGRNIG